MLPHNAFVRKARRASILTSYNALLEPFVATDVSWWGVGGAAFVHFARNDSQRFGGGVSLVSTQHDLRLLATCVRPYSDNTPRELIGSLCVCVNFAKQNGLCALRVRTLA